MKTTSITSDTFGDGAARVSLRLLYLAIGMGAVLVFFGLFVSDAWITSPLISIAVNFLRELVPCVKNVALLSNDPVRAAFVWGLGWLMSPMYLAAWFLSVPPWRDNVRSQLRTAVGRLYFRQKIMVIPGIIFLSCLILADFHLLDFISLYDGSIFSGGSQAPGLLRVPFTSTFGMALYAWLIPFCEVMCYWALIFLVVNFPIYFRTKSD